MKTEEMMVYEAPQVSVIEVEIEKGFAASEWCELPAVYVFTTHSGMKMNYNLALN